MNIVAVSLEAEHTHTHPHTLCLLKNKTSILLYALLELHARDG